MPYQTYVLFIIQARSQIHNPQSNSPDVFNMIVQKYATKNDKNVVLYDYHFVLYVTI